jgi:hypothetical protein
MWGSGWTFRVFRAASRDRSVKLHKAREAKQKFKGNAPACSGQRYGHT